MINLPDLILKNIKDQYVRENFKRINLFYQTFSLFKAGWQFFEITNADAYTNKKIPHGLGYKPLDVLQTSTIGTGVLTFNFDKFDDKNLDITTTGACTVRCFIGTYKQ